MKLLVEVKDSKAPELLQMLKELSFVKTTQITPEKASLIAQIQEAVNEMTMIKAGKKKANNAEAFINEL